MQKIKIGVVGLNWGLRMIEDQLLKGPGSPYFEVTAVCDLDEQKADMVGKKLGLKSYSTLQDILNDTEISTIAVFTGPAGRANVIHQIIRAGKHVMTTKPFEVDPHAAIDVLEEAKRINKVIHMNSPSPVLSPDLQQIKSWQKQYNLGRPIAAHWQTWCSYREKSDSSWYDDPQKCPAAPIFRLGIYAINDILRFFNRPSSVQVNFSKIFTQRPTPDNAQLTITFEDGCIADIFASFCIEDGGSYADSLIVNFERGTVYRNVGPSEDLDRRTRLQLMTRYQNKTLIENSDFERNLCCGAYMWDIFYRAINGEKFDEISPKQIAYGLKIIEALRRAQSSGATEKVE